MDGWTWRPRDAIRAAFCQSNVSQAVNKAVERGKSGKEVAERRGVRGVRTWMGESLDLLHPLLLIVLSKLVQLHLTRVVRPGTRCHLVEGERVVRDCTAYVRIELGMQATLLEVRPLVGVIVVMKMRFRSQVAGDRKRPRIFIVTKKPVAPRNDVAIAIFVVNEAVSSSGPSPRFKS